MASLGLHINTTLVSASATSGALTMNAYGQLFASSGSVAGDSTWSWRIARGLVVRPGTSSGYTLDGFGGIHPFGGAPTVTGSGYWPGWDIARAIALNPCDSNHSSGYVLDGWGGIHPFGGAPALQTSGYWQGWDIARAMAINSCAGGKVSGYVLDGWGGLHSFWQTGSTPIAQPTSSAYWRGWDIARGVTLRADGQGYVLDGYGGLHPFSGAPTVTPSGYWPGWDIARAVSYVPALAGGYVLDGEGGVHAFGSAPSVASPGWGASGDSFRALDYITSTPTPTSPAPTPTTTPTPVPTGTANLWVGSSAGSCNRSSTPAAFAAGSACGSLQAAYSAAHCGDTVGVAPATYSAQTISTNSKSCTASTPVIITSAPGAACTNNTAVNLPSVSVSVAYLTLSCLNANAAGSTSCSSIAGSSGSHSLIIWDTWDHVSVHCAFFDSDHMRITNSTFGPDDTCVTGMEDLVDFRANTDNINDVVFDHDTFETVTAPPDFECGIGWHVDSMQGYGMSNLTISDSNFYGCPGQCIIFRPYNGGTPGPFTFQNDFFDEPQSPGQTIDIGSSSSPSTDSCNGPILVQNNTFENGGALHGGCSNSPQVIIRNNIMNGGSCGFVGSNVTYANNVFYPISWTSATCGTGIKTCTPAFVAPTSDLTVPGDFHLASSDTCAKNAASQTAGEYAATDFDGDLRPLGAGVDAGADEIS